jgi:hypothetical protein
MDSAIVLVSTLPAMAFVFIVGYAIGQRRERGQRQRIARVAVEYRKSRPRMVLRHVRIRR